MELHLVITMVSWNLLMQLVQAGGKAGAHFFWTVAFSVMYPCLCKQVLYQYVVKKPVCRSCTSVLSLQSDARNALAIM